MTELTIPAGPDEITPQWLTEALGSTGTISDAKIVDVQSHAIGQGQGFVGQVFRTTLEYDAPKADSPQTLVAKLASADLDIRASTFGLNQNEVHFYEEVAPEVKLPTPRLYYSAADAETSLSILLLEDIPNARVGDNLAGCSIEEARLCFRQIGKFHAECWESPRFDQLPWLTAVTRQNPLTPEIYQQRWARFVEKFDDKLPDPLRETATAFANHVGPIGDQMMVQPTTMIHGDFRLDNLLFGLPGTGSPLTVFDWQLAAKGPGPIDIAYFMAFCLEPEQRRRDEMDLLKDYHDTLVENGVRGYGFDQCRQAYRLSIFLPMARMVSAGALLDFTSPRALSLISVIIERVNVAVADHRIAELLPSG